jgi:hypothetical protein
MFSFNSINGVHLVVTSCILQSMTHIFGVAKLLALVKFSNGIQPIVMGETFYRLVNRALCLQFHDTFSFHLSLHQIWHGD